MRSGLGLLTFSFRREEASKAKLKRKVVCWRNSGESPDLNLERQLDDALGFAAHGQWIVVLQRTRPSS